MYVIGGDTIGSGRVRARTRGRSYRRTPVRRIGQTTTNLPFVGKHHTILDTLDRCDIVSASEAQCDRKQETGRDIMTAQDIIDTIKAAGADTAKAIRDVLEDGQALAELGITDDDQEAVEEAHALVA